MKHPIKALSLKQKLYFTNAVIFKRQIFLSDVLFHSQDFSTYYHF